MNSIREELEEEELALFQKSKILALKALDMPGILVIPEGLTTWNEDEDETIVGALTDAIVHQAQGDIERCSMYAPIIIQGPSDLIKEVRHIKFGDPERLKVVQDRIDVLESKLASLNEL
jgi:hypothetical protein